VVDVGAAPGGWTSYLAGLFTGDKQVQFLELRGGLDQLPGWSLHRRQTVTIAGAAPGGWTSFLAGLFTGDKQVQILELSQVARPYTWLVTLQETNRYTRLSSAMWLDQLPDK
jgi:23S rRNA U2552 (ribose-2'-O)-methylase RlmE/FtsJ